MTSNETYEQYIAVGHRVKLLAMIFLGVFVCLV